MRVRRLVSAAATVGVCALGPGAASSMAGVANGGLPGAPKSNPLAGMTWGTWKPATRNVGVDRPAAYYHTAHNKADKATFAKILDQPRARWFGAWMPDRTARSVARGYIRDVTHGNPKVGAQMAIFRLQPWEGSACTHLPSRGQVASYKRWVKNFAKGIGSSRVALILQPDMPFALCLPGHSGIAFRELSFAARTFNAQPHTSVYIDAGSADYLGNAGPAARALIRAGIKHATGFTLNATHYTPNNVNAAHGRAVVRALAHRGAKGKHFIINTAGNGHPWISFKHRAAERAHRICRSKHQRLCITLGHPPTTKTKPPLDGYLWFGRPWADGSPLTYSSILDLVRTSPFF